MLTSKGVKGHLPLSLLAPGRMTRPGFVNFPFQPRSLAAIMSCFSWLPPSNTQQEKATISCKHVLMIYLVFHLRHRSVFSIYRHDIMKRFSFTGNKPLQNEDAQKRTSQCCLH